MSPRAVSGRLFDRYWWMLACVSAPLVIYLNQGAEEMQGIMPWYRCFRQVVVGGMDPHANSCPSPTFPMWGYGWVLAVTESRWAILVAQCLLSVVSVWVLVRTLERSGLLTARGSRLTKLLVVVSLPWYAFHALQWPYSVAVSLTLLSLAVLLAAVGEHEGGYLATVGSGVLFGLALEFRSDYIALVPLIVVVMIALVRPWQVQMRRMLVWVSAVLVALAPWIAYAYRATHQVILTSTNSGHVLYISLGQLPRNPWDITPSDGDPRMAHDIAVHFHGRVRSTLTYPADAYLRRRFVALVREHPLAWLEKDVYNLKDALTRGVYPGEFWTRPRNGSIAATLFGHGLAPLDRMRYGLNLASKAEAVLVPLIGFLLTPWVLVLSLRRRDIAAALISLLCVFQIAMDVFAYYMDAYSSNAYIPLLIVIVIAVQVIARTSRFGSRTDPLLDFGHSRENQAR